jgi:hypothetical protein
VSDRIDLSTDRAMNTNPQTAPDLATALSFENDDDGDGDLEFISADLAKSIAHVDKMINALTLDFHDLDASFSSGDRLVLNDDAGDEDDEKNENDNGKSYAVENYNDNNEKDKENNEKDKDNDKYNNGEKDNYGTRNGTGFDMTKSSPQDPKKAIGSKNTYHDDPSKSFSPCSDVMGPGPTITKEGALARATSRTYTARIVPRNRSHFQYIVFMTLARATMAKNWHDL